MKRILFILPLSVLLTYCSSSKKAASPAGVSNVQVNGAMNSSTTNTGDSRDWGYRSSRDTAMNGTWQLAGMIATDGSWKSAESWNPVDTTTVMMDSINPASVQTSTDAKSFSGKLYDTSMHFFDTAAFKQKLDSRVMPFRYWQRLPEIKIMANLGIFTGNTGCNSMSGSFNFSGTDIRVDKRLRTSKMACNDYDETSFISSLLKADNYNVNNGMLELKQGNTLLLSFKKKV